MPRIFCVFKAETAFAVPSRIHKTKVVGVVAMTSAELDDTAKCWAVKFKQLFGGVEINIRPETLSLAILKPSWVRMEPRVLPFGSEFGGDELFDSSRLDRHVV